MEKLEFFPIDAVSKIEGNKAVIYIYGVSSTGKVLVKYSGFEPYFLVLPKPGKEEEVKNKLTRLRLNLDGRKALVDKVETVTKIKGLDEGKFLKCFTPIPQDVEKLAREVKRLDEVEHVYEKDIKFTKRLFVDKGIFPLQRHIAVGEFVNARNRAKIFRANEIQSVGEESLSDFKVLAFDIETPSKEINPDKHPVLMIALYSKAVKRVLTWKEFPTKSKYVEFLDSEKAMIERFGKLIENIDPDIVCGYYSDGFDFPYIKARAEKLGAEFKPGLNYSSVRMSGGQKKSAYIEGIPHIDVFKFIRYIWAQGLQTSLYDLDSVSMELLGEGKKDVEIGKLWEAWVTGGSKLERFVLYNLKDAELTYKLCEKILPNVVELVKLTQLTPFDVSRSRFSKLVESYLISQAFQKGILIPNLPGHDKINQRRRSSFKGAFVYEPKPGLYRNVAVFDFRSLYPSIIAAHNISPETLNCKCCKDSAERVPGREDLWFCMKNRGFIPMVIKELITRRMRLKEIIRQQGTSRVMEARSYALKTLANAMYGYIGFFASRWYSFEAALSITAYGRHYIAQVIDKAEKQGFKVIYGDTDSIFVDLNGKTISDAMSFSDSINTHLPGIMKLKFEGFFPSALFVSIKDTATGAKKKYALIDNKGNLKITGFETVRRNWSLVARRAQLRVLEIVLREHNIKKALEYVASLIEKVKRNEIDKKEMIIKTQLTKPIGEYEAVGPHVAVAKKLINTGHNVQTGDIIEYIILNGSGRIGDRAVPAESVKNPNYDTEYYVKNQILPAVEPIFKELGVSKEQILTKQDQSKLDTFLNGKI